jgi:hypothetical protein
MNNWCVLEGRGSMVQGGDCNAEEKGEAKINRRRSHFLIVVFDCSCDLASGVKNILVIYLLLSFYELLVIRSGTLRLGSPKSPLFVQTGGTSMCFRLSG